MVAEEASGAEAEVGVVEGLADAVRRLMVREVVWWGKGWGVWQMQ